MNTTTTVKEKAMSFLPTKEEAISGAKDLSMVAAGMIAAHAVITATKKDTALVNGGVAVIGLGVAMKAKNPLVKMLALGASAYGTIKLINSATKEVATPGTTEGLNGILPEKAKTFIRKFIPTLGGMDDFAGKPSNNDSDDMKGTDREIENLSLDDFGTRGDATGNIVEDKGTAGLGEVINLAA